MRTADIITEGRIGTALWRNSIPRKYKQYPIIGQGATSIVLDMGDGNVLMLTRDGMKKDWLVNGLGIGKFVEQFVTPHVKSKTLSEMPVYAIQLPKLFPLSVKNKTAIAHAIEQYQLFFPAPRNVDPEWVEQRINRYLEKQPDGLFVRLLTFLQDYEPTSYGPDFLTRNFMQNANGEVVLIDPIVSSELLNELIDLRDMRNSGFR